MPATTIRSLTADETDFLADVRLLLDLDGPEALAAVLRDALAVLPAGVAHGSFEATSAPGLGFKLFGCA